MAFLMKAMPNTISERFELPDIAELLMENMFYYADVEEAWKKGTNFLRYMIDHAPLKHDKKYVLVESHVQLLAPGYTPTSSIYDDPTQWHIDHTDGVYTEPRDRHHLLLSNCTTLTEFLAEPFELKDFDPSLPYGEFERYLNEHGHKFDIKRKQIEPCRFITFENEPHKSVFAQRIEFRYFLRFTESDSLSPVKNPDITDIVAYRNAKNKEVLMRSIGDTITIENLKRTVFSGKR